MGGVDKLFTLLAGKPLVAWTLQAFEDCPPVTRIVLVLHPRRVDDGKKLVAEAGWKKVVEVCPGGLRRQDSVAEGLRRLPGCPWVIIHDGSRPLVTPELIVRGLEAARETGAAVAAVSVKDTIKRVNKAGLILETPERQSLWSVQTPQVFRYDLILRAYSEAGGEVTDDAALLERLGHPVKVYPGSYENIKVTTPEDLLLAEMLLRRRLG